MEKDKIISMFIDLIKSIIYRIYSSFITFLISYSITKKASIGLSIGIADFFIKILSYFFYERVFNKLLKSKYNKRQKNDYKLNRTSRRR